MGTDDSTTDSDGGKRLRGRLTPPGFGEHGASGIRERLPSPDIERVQPVGVRERLPSPDIDDGIAPELRERLPRPAVRGRLSAPRVGERLPESGVRERLSGEAVRERLPDGRLREQLSVREAGPTAPRVSLPERGLDAPNALGQRLRDTETTTPEYFVGVVPADHDEVERRLGASPFSRSYVTYPKVLVDEERDIEREADSVWVYRSWSLSHFQLHVPVFELPEEDAVYVFYHHEYNWLRHPVEHLDAEYLNPEFDRDRIVDLFAEAGLSVRTCRELDGRFPTASAYCGGEPA